MINFNSKDKSKDGLILEQKKMELGWLGKLFGDKEAAPTNIVGMMLLFFAVSIPFVFIFSVKVDPLDYIKTVGSMLAFPAGSIFRPDRKF